MPTSSPRIIFTAFLGVSLLGGNFLAAQTPQTPTAAHAAAPAAPPIPAELQHRIEVIVRNHFSLPPEMQLIITGPSPSDIAGYNNINVTVVNGEKVAGKVTMLISGDLKTLLGVVRFDLTKDPAGNISVAGRPVRGNPNAPVKIIVFDDLECPYCAMMHAKLFPNTADHYKDKVAYIYKDFPLVDSHPWAMRAAVDVNCIAKLETPASNAAYWRLVDAIHAQAHQITDTKSPAAPKDAPAAGAKPEGKTVALTPVFDRLDTMTRDEATRSHLDLSTVDACIKQQDQSAIEASIHEGDALKLDATPTLYVDGEKLEGVADDDVLYNTIDDALQAHGVEPPSRAAATPPAKPAAPSPGTGGKVSPAKP